MIKIYKSDEEASLEFVGLFVKLFDVGKESLTRNDYQYIFSYSCSQFENSWGSFYIP